MTSTDYFDAALISASPLALTEALLLAREGKRVIVLDRRDAIGGAWRKEDTLGYVDVEVGCHLLIEDPAIPCILQALWGITLEPLRPDPQQLIYWRGRLLQERYGGFGASAWLHGVGAATRAVRLLTNRRRPEDQGLRGIAKSLWQFQGHGRLWLKNKRARSIGFLYPRGGTGEMMRALSERVREAGIVLRLGTEVAGVRIEPKGACLSLRDGHHLIARQVILTRGSQIEAINDIVIPEAQIVRRHWVVVLDDPTSRAFSYLQFRGHPDVERVSDVTGFARTPAGDRVEPGRKILCIFVKNALYQKGREAAERRLLEFLKERRWIDEAASPLASEWWEDTETSRNYKFITQLEAANPAIRLIPQINLGRYLRDNVLRVSPGVAATLRNRIPEIVRQLPSQDPPDSSLD